MKKLCLITFCVIICLTCNAQSYLYQPWQPSMGPLTFNTLGDHQHPYVQCKTSSDWNNPTQVINPNNTAINNPANSAATHAIITSNVDDPCRCQKVGNNYPHVRYLPPSWENGSYAPQDLQDTVIRIGCGTNNNSCNCAQQIEYWFYPEDTLSTLLVLFSIALQNCYTGGSGGHGVDINGCAYLTNPQFYIEVFDANGNLLDLGYYPQKPTPTNPNPTQANPNWPYARFLAWPSGCDWGDDYVTPPDENGHITYYWAGQTNNNPPSSANGFATPTTFDYFECPDNQTSGHSISYPVQWYEYKPLAFDLSSIASQNVDANGNFQPNQSVKLRIHTVGCSATAHWAYALFTAKMIPGDIQVEACGEEPIHLSVPWGFLEPYTWYRGLNALDVDSNKPQHVLDEYNLPVGYTMDGYNIYIDRETLQSQPNETLWPYYRCEMKSYTGVPFVFETYIQLHQIEPDFTFEQNLGGESVIGQFHDASLVQLITPSGAPDWNFDTLNQAPETIQWYVKHYGIFVLFAENDPEPIHSFTEGEIDENNTATVRIVVSSGHCIKDTTKTIPLSLVSVPVHETALPTLYPNPTNGIVYLQAVKPVLSVELLTIDGKTLSGECPWQRGNTTGKIDLSAFEPGCYLIVLHYADGESEQWKVIKQ